MQQSYRQFVKKLTTSISYVRIPHYVFRWCFYGKFFSRFGYKTPSIKMYNFLFYLFFYFFAIQTMKCLFTWQDWNCHWYNCKRAKYYCPYCWIFEVDMLLRAKLYRWECRLRNQRALCHRCSAVGKLRFLLFLFLFPSPFLRFWCFN